ncbi:uncharacterized protein LOC130780007 [Actinidia eriantha]|uniref:uncharacterized protein LOC130780007 n=1 Tax=Actinidia eriantha TaxID=165200 RepID=UPI00258E1402|nr:uncharacterized protein LOC130780007 [Actinidia eriantha]
MAARSGASEGINLISSIYSDDDDDMEDVEHQEPPNDDVNTTAMEDGTRNNNSEERGVDSVNDDTPPLSSDRSRPLTPQQQPQLSLSSPPLQPPVVSEPSRSRLHRLTIVDYGHDEVALSPEAEDGEIVGAGVVTIGTQLQTNNGDMQETPPPGTAQVLSPSNQTTTTQLSQQPCASESHTMNYAVNVSESTGIEEAVTVSVEVSTDVDPFDRFLPPPPMARCSDELQEKINKFLYLKRLGKSYNAEVRKKKEYRNPDFLLHAVTYQDIDEIGSCFSKDVFDPHGYDKSDYYAEIEADMKRELDRKEQEKKKSQKVEFVTGGTQPVVVAPTPKINIPIPGVTTVATGGLHPVDSGARDRQNKKSKWDKVDGDRRNPLHSGGQDSVSTASAHATLLTAANAGTGYTAFAQQRRREAEEKRSSERKMERRS